jgi:hypothetical protein
LGSFQVLKLSVVALIRRLIEKRAKKRDSEREKRRENRVVKKRECYFGTSQEKKGKRTRTSKKGW